MKKILYTLIFSLLLAYTFVAKADVKKTTTFCSVLSDLLSHYNNASKCKGRTSHYLELLSNTCNQYNAISNSKSVPTKQDLVFPINLNAAITKNDYLFAKMTIGEDNEQFALERSINNDGGYLSIFRFFCSEGQPIDLSFFDGLEFNAKESNLLLNITLVKSSISNFKNQPTITIKLEKSEQRYTIPFSKITSRWHNKPNFCDITAVVFTVESKGGTIENLSKAIGQLSFKQTDTSLANGALDK